MKKKIIVILLASITFISCQNQIQNKNNLNDNTNNQAISSKEQSKINKEIVSIFTSLSEISLNIGEKKKLEATVNFNDNSTSNDIFWKSSNPEITTVDSNGNIEALKEGRAEIIISSKDNPTKTIKILVNVNKPNFEIPSSQPTINISSSPNISPSPSIISSPIIIPSPTISSLPSISSSPTTKPSINNNFFNVNINGYVYDDKGIIINDVDIIISLLEDNALWSNGNKSISTKTSNGRYIIKEFTTGTKIEIKAMKEAYKEEIQFGILTLNLPFDENINKFDFGQKNKINSQYSLRKK